MSAKDAMLFIDANKYLDLYRMDGGKKLLKVLEEQASHIFVTQQVVNEVRRNQVNVAAEFLKTKSQIYKIQTIAVPDHFSGDGNPKEFLDKMKSISGSIKTVNNDLDAYFNQVMTQISNSNDELSKALISIFSKAVSPTVEEMQRARVRKEIGNPPGKRNGPIGDEISWEQILTKLREKKRLWIITRDGDYATSFGGSLYVNAFLKSELDEISDQFEVYIFTDLLVGMEHFTETTKVKSKLKLNLEERSELATEERSLPPIDSSGYSGSSVHNLERALKTLQPTLDIERAMKSIQPTLDIERALKSIQPTLDIERALKSIQPTLDIERALKSIQPTLDIERALKSIQPTLDIERVLKSIQPMLDIERALKSIRPTLGAENALKSSLTSKAIKPMSHRKKRE